jgi:hypothetical protein
MARRVDVGAVVGGVGVACALDAAVPRRAAVGPHEPAVERAPSLRHLVGLGVVDEVAVDDDRVGPGGVERTDRGGQDLEAERLLRAEDRGEGRAEAVEERRPGRRLLVADVGVGEDPDAAEHAPGLRGRREVGAGAQRLARAAAERPVAVGVGEGGGERGAVGGRGRRAAAGPVVLARDRDRGDRDEQCREGGEGAAPRGHSSRSPATGGSATARRAVHAAAATASPTSPITTRAA